MTKKSILRGLELFALSLVIFVAIPGLKAEAASATETQCFASVFDSDYYAANYQDVVQAFGSDPLALLEHYIHYGVYEGRNASATFNATDYMNRYADLQLSYGTNMPAYVYHYVASGVAEGRDATPVSVGITTYDDNYTFVAIYTTEYNSTVARATNVELAANNVNNTVVAPGATFSANTAIGPRTAANGFVEAPVFINKEHAMGIGGGVCQVSSTIYATLKTAGITATERHAHSLPVNYLPEGWDATISGNVLDLKFVNPYDRNLVVETFAQAGELTVAFYLIN